MPILNRRAIRKALSEKENSLGFKERGRYVFVSLWWNGATYWLMADDGKKGQYIKDLAPEEAEKYEPGIVERVKKERLARFPASEKGDLLFAAYKKRFESELGKISLTAEEKVSLEGDIRVLEKEYTDLAFPGWKKRQSEIDLQG